MELEIERKWLADDDIKQYIQRSGWKTIRQAYFSDNVRVRIDSKGIDPKDKSTAKEDVAIICIKNRVSELTVKEYNYVIPVEDAEELLSVMNVIQKKRYSLGNGYTLDMFENDLIGLLLVEKEFENEELAEAEEVPEEWTMVEVTGDPRFINANLGDQAFSDQGLVPRLNDQYLFTLTGDDYDDDEFEPENSLVVG